MIKTDFLGEKKKPRQTAWLSDLTRDILWSWEWDSNPRPTHYECDIKMPTNGSVKPNIN